jgi:uncharacterized protein
MVSRRKALLWCAAAVAGTGIFLVSWAFWLEPASLRVVEDRIRLARPLGAPIRVAILTDLHIGSPFNNLDKLRDIVARTNAAQPDLICILGDLLSNGPRGARSERPGFIGPEQVASELAKLRAPVGVFGVLGNHDNWLDHDRVAAALENNGVRLLEDKAARLDTPAGAIWLAGVSDYWTRSHDVAAALAGITDAAPIILFTHNPDLFPEVPDRVALTLAGHTHGVRYVSRSSARSSCRRVSVSGLPRVTSSKADGICSSRPESAPASSRCDSACRPRSRS